MNFIATVGHAQLWRQFLPSGDAASAERGTAADLALTQENGPWLIVAASFSGEGAAEQAQALTQELRSRYRLPAYLHEMSFKLGDEPPGRGLDQYGAPVRRRFRRGDEVHELAVLVGDFPSIDHPDAQKALERIKTLQPNALNVEASDTAQSMAQVRRFEDAVLEKLGKSRNRGPMAQAFFTRNPLLPREYFVPKGVDAFVAKMNDGVEHSLLDCPGRYTIRVATFRGKTILQASAKQDQSAKSFWGRRKSDDDNPLVEAAENAHLLTKQLRAAGWEAYEFHDRTESIVTIGSFAQVAQQLPDGRVLAIPAADKIMRTFGAAYDTPADPLTGIGNDEVTQRRVEQEEQQFNLRLGSQQGQIVPGLYPKHVKIITGSGKRRHLERIIPMDPTPQAIEVPKRSISGAYAG
ncbi:MAG: hypothetical protein WD738_22835 [Pirellulales bacterium]